MNELTIAIIFDDEAIAVEIAEIVRGIGFRADLLDAARPVRIALHQARPIVVVLVHAQAASLAIWNALQVLWLDPVLAHLPTILCLRDLDSIPPSRLSARPCLRLPVAGSATALLAALATTLGLVEDGDWPTLDA
jgi:hypothetical protein